MNKHKIGLALGGLFGLLHALWALFVAVGVAQPLVDFIFRVHFIRSIYSVQPFDFGNAILLVVVTTVVGYVVGVLFALVWHRVNGKK